jgi:CubicO group peptidase (beta-lactamase class C family)
MKQICSSYLTILILSINFLACTKEYISNIYKYNQPLQTNDGLNTSTLDDVKINSLFIEKMVDDIDSNKFGAIHSALIIKDNKLVLDEYFGGYNKDKLHEICSVSKSFCSALMGIAIDKQFIPNENSLIKNYLPEYSDIDWTGKENITIKDFLTMSSGFKWDEWSTGYSDPANIYRAMVNSSDPVKYVLNETLVSEPGSAFTYNTGLPILLGRVISNASNMNIDSFATKYLFNPLGIGAHKWQIYGNKTYSTGSSLNITPRDMAKFGLLYLNKGQWNGKQIISGNWITKSAESHMNLGNGVFYGYYWWKIHRPD